MKHGNSITAHAAVAKAIATGRLEHPSKLKCSDCCNPASDYDHRDYRKPLDVSPVCRGCNIKRGPALSCQCRKCDGTVQIQTRVPKEMYDAIAELAKSNLRSIAAETLAALQAHIGGQKNGQMQK